LLGCSPAEPNSVLPDIQIYAKGQFKVYKLFGVFIVLCACSSSENEDDCSAVEYRHPFIKLKKTLQHLTKKV
jgi:hypothetical protein